MMIGHYEKRLAILCCIFVAVACWYARYEANTENNRNKTLSIVLTICATAGSTAALKHYIPVCTGSITSYEQRPY